MYFLFFVHRVNETKEKIDNEYDDDSKNGLPYLLIDELLINLN